MKVTHLIFSLTTGGAENMLVDLVNEQIKFEKIKEVNIIIINNIYNKEIINHIDKRVKIHFINRIENSKNLISVIKLNLLLLKLNSNVLHCHNHNIIPLFFPFLYRRSVLTLHGLDVPVKYIGRYKKLFAISNSVKDDIISRANINSIVVYNGISTSLIDIKQKYIFKSKFKIVCVGRLDHKIKGQHLAIQAIYFLSKKGVNNIQLDLIGTGCSEEYLKKLTAEYGLSEKVTFLGLKDRDYIYGQLKVYDLLIQPSLFEGFGLTLAESMAAKIPFLVSNIQGPMEVIDNGKNGYCFEVGNVKSLVEKIELIIANYYSEDMYQMIESAHIRVKTCFDIKETAKKYIDEYLLN